MEDQKLAVQRFDRAILYVDKLLPLLPPFSHFNTSTVILSSGWDQQDIDEAYILDLYIEILLVNKLKYAHKLNQASEQNEGFWIELNDSGRAAQKAGGHFKYEAKLQREANRADTKETYDLELKRLALKYKFVTFGIPIISLVIALFSIGFTLYKDRKSALPPTELNLKLTIQSDTLKPFFHVDTSFFKNNVSINSN